MYIINQDIKPFNFCYVENMKKIYSKINPKFDLSKATEEDVLRSTYTHSKTPWTGKVPNQDSKNYNCKSEMFLAKQFLKAL